MGREGREVHLHVHVCTFQGVGYGAPSVSKLFKTDLFAYAPGRYINTAGDI